MSGSEARLAAVGKPVVADVSLMCCVVLPVVGAHAERQHGLVEREDILHEHTRAVLRATRDATQREHRDAWPRPSAACPHADPQEAVKVVLASIPDAPIWPQLPANGINEQMEVQYSEGIPRVVIDRDKQRMYIDTTGDSSHRTGRLLRKVPAPKTSITSRSRPRFPRASTPWRARSRRPAATRPFVKVQTTGPLSFGLTIVDENKRAIHYNPDFIDVVLKALAMKCRWQIRKFRPFAERVICFIDEPILSAFGSSTYVSVTRDDVVSPAGREWWRRCTPKAPSPGCTAAATPSGRILIDAGVDIVNFDAFDYGETIALYPEAVKRHLEAGNALAWGIVPTNSAKIQAQTAESLVNKFNGLVDHLAKATELDRDLIVRQALITPSCGTGSLPVADAERVFKILRETSVALHEKACATA